MEKWFWQHGTLKLSPIKTCGSKLFDLIFRKFEIKLISELLLRICYHGCSACLPTFKGESCQKSEAQKVEICEEPAGI